MGKNVEVKAELKKPEYLRLLTEAEKLSQSQATVLNQTDTFFNVPNDRLKLRGFDDGTAELIAYRRSDQSQPKLSDYIRTSVDDPVPLKQSLMRCLGIRGVIKKRRELFLVGQTRIHLDHVEDLGHFVELEVVLEENQSRDDGIAIANKLMNFLGIKTEQLVSTAYIDLLESIESKKST